MAKKLSKLQSSYKKFSKPTVFVLITLAAVAGIYLVFHSFAASAVPPAGGYWPVAGILPPGTTSFPSDATCAAQVHRSPWEPRATNYAQNHYIPPATMGNFSIWSSTWNSTYKPRITGNFTGTTDEIMQWAACKWGWSDELIRAESVTESNWYEGEFTSSGAPVNGHGFGDFHDCSNGQCPWALAYLGANNAILTHPMVNPGPDSYGILQNRAYYHPQGYALSAPPNQSSYPWTSLSTAFAIDEQVAELRGCYDGMSTFMGNTKGDLWGCVQSWFSGSYTPGGSSYSQNVQGNLSSRPWASWADQCAQTPAGCSTSGGGGDTTAPTASLTAPSGNISGTTAISPTSSDNIGVTKVEFYIDNSLTNTDTSSPFSYSWNTANVANGNHNVFVKAYDAAGNVGTSNTVTYNVQNLDTTAPAAPTNVKATANNTTSVTVTWSASTDPSGIASYKVYRNGSSTPIFTSPNNSTLSFTDTTVVANTAYSYTVTATDVPGNQSAQSAAATVTTPNPSDTTNPTASITAPSANQTVSGSVAVSATAADNVGVTKVEFYVDGILAASPTAPAASYGFNWNAGTVANGNHIIMIKAYDAAGNVGSNQVTVNVSNPIVPPNPPTNVTATANSYSSVTVKWTASTSAGVAGYYILRATAGGIPTTLPAVSAATTSFTDSNLQSSTVYTYQVEAFDASNNVSGPSLGVNVTTPQAPAGDTTAPTTPLGLTATAVSSSQINLSWHPSTDDVGVTSYDIYRNGTLLNTLTPPFNTNPYSCTSHPTLTTLSSPPATGSTTYICTQRAQWFLNANGASLSVDGWDGTNTTNAVKAYQTKVGLPVTGAVDAATWNSLEASVNVTFGDTNLTAGTSYSYYVVAKDAAGNSSAASNTGSATTQAPVANGNVSGSIKLSNSSNPYSCSSHPTLSYVSSSPSSGSTNYVCTKRVQWFLNTINNAKLSVDGWYGNNTTNAVKAYQIRFGLQVDGITGGQTWNSLEAQGGTTAAGSGAQVRYSIGSTNNIVSADSSGNYTITGLPAATYSMVYSLVNYASQTKSVTVTGGQTTTQNITLQHL